LKSALSVRLPLEPKSEIPLAPVVRSSLPSSKSV
jgi:hypothetical protein